MNPIIAFSTVSKQFVSHRNSMMKLEYDINSGSAAIVYVQVHDFPAAVDLAAGRTAPAAGSVPIKSWPAFQSSSGNYKEFKNGELAVANGLFVCVSTTQATLTIGTGNNKFDSVSAETWEADITGSTTVQSTGAATQTVWSETTGLAGDLKLIRAACTNLEAGVRYLMLYATNAATGGSIPLQQWTLAATGDGAGGDTIEVSFGTGVNGAPLGLFVRSQDPATLANKQGCLLVLSTTAGTYTATVGAGANFYAEYKAEA